MSTNEIVREVLPKTGCFFADETAMSLEDNEAHEFIRYAQIKGCNGECTLESGCVLFKHLRSLAENVSMQGATSVLRREFIDFMLGGEE